MVRIYRERRLTVVEGILGENFLDAFRRFCEVWIHRYDLEDPASLDAFRVLTHKQRQSLYERFARECRLWEATLRLKTPADFLPVHDAFVPTVSEEPAAEDSWRRRRQEVESRERRRKDFYDRLSCDMQSQSLARILPYAIREAFLKLGIPAGAPIEEVRKAYRQLALTNHPDQQGDHGRMADLNRAYRKIVDHLRGTRQG